MTVDCSRVEGGRVGITQYPGPSDRLLQDRGRWAPNCSTATVYCMPGRFHAVHQVIGPELISPLIRTIGCIPQSRRWKCWLLKVLELYTICEILFCNKHPIDVEQQGMQPVAKFDPSIDVEQQGMQPVAKFDPSTTGSQVVQDCCAFCHSFSRPECTAVQYSDSGTYASTLDRGSILSTFAKLLKRCVVLRHSSSAGHIQTVLVKLPFSFYWGSSFAYFWHNFGHYCVLLVCRTLRNSIAFSIQQILLHFPYSKLLSTYLTSFWYYTFFMFISYATVTVWPRLLQKQNDIVLVLPLLEVFKVHCTFVWSSTVCTTEAPILHKPGAYL